jgi:hypothetical protein
MPRMSASCMGDGVAAIVHAVSWLPSVTHVNAACPVEECEGESEWAICHAGPMWPYGIGWHERLNQVRSGPYEALLSHGRPC